MKLSNIISSVPNENYRAYIYQVEVLEFRQSHGEIDAILCNDEVVVFLDQELRLSDGHAPGEMVYDLDTVWHTVVKMCVVREVVVTEDEFNASEVEKKDAS